MIPYIFNILSLILGIVSGVRPYTFLGNYILVQSFLMLNEYKVDYKFFQISSYRVFVLAFLLILLAKAISNKKSIKDVLFFQSKNYSLLLGIYFLFNIAVIIFHHQSWGGLPQVFMYKFLKSTWPIFILLIPFENFELKKMFHYLAMAMLAIILLLTPGSIHFFYDYKASFFRLREHWDYWQHYTGIFKLNGEVIPILRMTEMAAVVWSIFSASLVFFIGNVYEDYKTTKWKAALFFIFLTYILYINESGRMIAFFFIQLFFVVFLKFNSKHKKQTALLMLGISAVIISMITFNSELRNKFIREEINLSHPTNDYSRRIPILKYTLAKTLFESPWRGFGYPEDLNKETVLPSKKAIVAQSTGHSEGIDNIFYFGVPFGVLASSLYWLPLLILLFSFPRLWKVAREDYTLLFVICFLGFIARFVGELGRDVYSDVLFMYLFVMILVFRNKKGQV